MKASCTITRPDDTTAYTALDVVGGVLQFIGGEVPVQSDLFITTTTFSVHVASVPAGMSSFKLHLYDSRPATIADNAAWDLPAGDRAAYLGYVDLGTPVDVGSTLFVQATEVNKHIRMPAHSVPLYGFLVTTTGYTPSALAVKVINLHMVKPI